MKIVFWGIDRPHETTQNMNALIEQLNWERPNCKIRVFRKKGCADSKRSIYKKEDHILLEQNNCHSERTEFLFYDCGNQRDKSVKKQMQRADLLVINMPQSESTWENLALDPVICAGHMIYLVSNYFETSLLNREKIEKTYRIESDRIGIIPYNNEFNYASERGKLKEFIRNDMRKNEKNQTFQRELKRTLNLMLNNLCKV